MSALKVLGQHRYVIAVNLASLVLGALIFEPMQPAPPWFLLAWCVGFGVALVADFRRRLPRRP